MTPAAMETLTPTCFFRVPHMRRQEKLVYSGNETPEPSGDFKRSNCLSDIIFLAAAATCHMARHL